MIALQKLGFRSDQHPKIDSFVRSSETLITEIAKGCFAAISEHAKEALPSLAIMTVQVFYPALFFFLTDSEFLLGTALVATIATPFLLLRFPPKGITPICYYAQLLAASATAMELAVSVLFPPSLAIHLAVQGLVISASLLGNMNTIKKGVVKLREGLSESTLRTSEKVSRVVYGLISIGLGTVGSIATIKTGARLYRGVNKYLTLDSTQQRFALKFHGVESLGDVKTQKAVLIDGLNGDWAEEGNYYFDNQPDPGALVIYNRYETRAYHVNSSEELSCVLDQAKKDLGGNLDVVSFFGHSDDFHMRLGPDYDFIGTVNELDAIQRNILPGGEILLWGCETGMEWRGKSSSIARYISKWIPDHVVTGFSEDLDPLQSWAWFDGKKVQVSAWADDMFDIKRQFLNGKRLVTG